ncbi:MAG: flavodoxin family protein [Candidatus Bathyarchaeota archaeon]|jgi:multimeric flavodoxin WrbA|nr:flavodoxin family protein [Candidatus Bathyarchaeota archaeon A05DMB-5]MDH7558188.1 flavodoxin family protein [Candidatus Bathyarchaeota archaeon]
MKSKLKILAIIGSHRKNGNSYALAKAVLEPTGADYEIIQLANKKIEFCNLCEKCVSNNCILEDDVNSIIKKIKSADGIVFVIPKYLFVASKFLCFLERLDTIQHMRTHEGYQHTAKNPDYRLFSEEKPFCIFITSGTGKVEKGTLKIVADYIEYLGLKLVRSDKPPCLGAAVKAGDAKGEVLRNKKGVKECKNMVEKLICSIRDSE